MPAPHIKTRSEQRLEWLQAENHTRKLTDDEQWEINRCLHAIYERNRRNRLLAMHEREDAKLLKTVEAESRMPERYAERDE